MVLPVRQIGAGGDRAECSQFQNYRMSDGASSPNCWQKYANEATSGDGVNRKGRRLEHYILQAVSDQ
ncbi:hypothetical protein ARMGADRAFT_1005921 [Armillaria gallica]|uniref:Uncharacterized protein n=1 Tax=Armillaria gallica TaxID=47427 RepID=A0A2H3EGJ0_ARMGA|nr:hypothetical protein ARMGADRAFT_1005921 [Armillaria gallica]